MDFTQFNQFLTNDGLVDTTVQSELDAALSGGQMNAIVNQPQQDVLVNAVQYSLDDAGTPIHFAGVTNGGEIDVSADSTNPLTIVSDGQNDTINLSDAGNDHIYLAGGVNHVQLGGGHDTLFGQGLDFISTGASGQTINETGTALVTVANDNDVVSTANGLVNVTGSNNTISTGGQVQLMGGSGNHVALMGSGSVVDSVGGNKIALEANGGAVILTGAVADTVVDTGTSNTIVEAGTGNDVILGNTTTTLNFQNLASTDLLSATLNAKTGLELLVFDNGQQIKVGGGITQANFSDGASIALSDPDAPVNVVGVINHVEQHIADVLAHHHIG